MEYHHTLKRAKRAQALPSLFSSLSVYIRACIIFFWNGCPSWNVSTFQSDDDDENEIYVLQVQPAR